MLKGAATISGCWAGSAAGSGDMLNGAATETGSCWLRTGSGDMLKGAGAETGVGCFWGAGENETGTGEAMETGSGLGTASRGGGEKYSCLEGGVGEKAS